METREQHSGLLYKTRGDESPQGRPKVYFCSTETDQEKYFEDICADLFKFRPECAIFYKGENDRGFTRERQEVMEEMQMFVMPVTTDLLTKENEALSQEFPFAQAHRIPVLPLMQEKGLEDIFNLKCGELQFLDKNTEDHTAISYEDKLKKYLDAVLIGDETVQKIQSAFDAYIFLSYRKKDRKQAQNLMRLIHKNEDFQDIAIWYDEFLVPGENFNRAIEEALKKCDIFTLLVTPNLVNEPNYVQEKEYPAAIQSQKPILPVEAQKTDREALEKQYPEIPLCAAPEEGRLSEEMHARLTRIALGENNNDPMHLFFMGLAYLGGIDVERNPERAERLLKKSADLGLPEACGKLARMYSTGEGVERNYETAAQWLQKQAGLLKALWEKEQTEDSGDRYFDCLYELGDAWDRLSRYEEAQKVYEDLVHIAEARAKEAPQNAHLSSDLAASYNCMGKNAENRGDYTEAERWHMRHLKIASGMMIQFKTEEDCQRLGVAYLSLGDVYTEIGNLPAAEACYRTSLKLFRSLEENFKNTDVRRNIAISYVKLGINAEAQGKYSEAADWYGKNLEQARALTEEMRTSYDRQYLAVAYEKMGDMEQRNRNFSEADRWFRQELELLKALAEETGTIMARRDYAAAAYRMGDIAKQYGKTEKAEAWYRKCLDITQALAEEAGTLANRRALAVAYERLAILAEEQQQFPEAEAWYRNTVDLQKVLTEESKGKEAVLSLASSYAKLGSFLRTIGNFGEAEAFCREALKLDEPLSEETDLLIVKQDLAGIYDILGDIADDTDDLSQADIWYRKELDIRNVLGGKDIRSMQLLVQNYSSLGDIANRRKDPAAALKWFREAFAILNQLPEPGTDPQITEWGRYVSYQLLKLESKPEWILKLKSRLNRFGSKKK